MLMSVPSLETDFTRLLLPRNLQCPGRAKNDRVAECVSVRLVLVLILEKEKKVLLRHNEVGLPADRMDRIIRRRARNGSAERPSQRIVRQLPLVIANHTNLKQFAQIFAEWQYLPETPFIGERLTWRFIHTALGDLFLPMNFPIGKDVRAGPFVFGQVNRGAHEQMISEVARPDIV